MPSFSMSSAAASKMVRLPSWTASFSSASGVACASAGPLKAETPMRREPPPRPDDPQANDAAGGRPERTLGLQNRLEPHPIGPTDIEVASSQPLRVILDFGLDDHQVAVLWLCAGVHT